MNTITSSYRTNFRLMFNCLRLRSFSIQDTDTHSVIVLTKETCITYARLFWKLASGMFSLGIIWIYNNMNKFIKYIKLKEFTPIIQLIEKSSLIIMELNKFVSKIF